jgi:imidazolonepropionase-like amidohydrolase
MLNQLPCSAFWRRFVFALVTLSTTPFVVDAQEKTMAIVNTTIIDGHGGKPIENGTILVKQGKITLVGKQIEVPAGAQIIDAKGLVAIPGLADMHVHLSWGGEDHDMLGYQRRLDALLYAGVTTVLDTGNVLPYVRQIKQAIDNGKILGPNLYYVGPLIDSLDPAWPAISRSMSAESQAPYIAKYLKDNGASAIKAYAKLSRPQVRALVVAGEKYGLPVIVDAWFRNGAEHYVTVGLRAFAHTPRRVTEETLSVMKKNNVFIITTRAVGGIGKHASLRGASFLENDLIRYGTPPWLLDKAKQDVKRLLSDDDVAKESFSKAFHDRLQRNVKRIFDAGIPLVAGTDNSGLFTGDDLHFELELLVDAGLTPLEAITAATKNAAAMMNDENKWGTLTSGKRADILLVSGRPDKNIQHTRNIELVIKNGQLINRDELRFDQGLDSGIRSIEFGY